MTLFAFIIIHMCKISEHIIDFIICVPYNFCNELSNTSIYSIRPYMHHKSIHSWLHTNSWQLPYYSVWGPTCTKSQSTVNSTHTVGNYSTHIQSCYYQTFNYIPLVSKLYKCLWNFPIQLSFTVIQVRWWSIVEQRCFLVIRGRKIL